MTSKTEDIFKSSEPTMGETSVLCFIASSLIALIAAVLRYAHVQLLQ